jgi:Flp pilus assembly protein TadG
MEASVETPRGKRRPTLLRRFIGSKRGQSLAEFALILPVLVLLMLGAIDFGRVFFAYISVTNAARNGADYASFSSVAANDLTGIRAAVVGDTGDLLNTSDSNPQVTSTTGTDSQGRLYADVTVTYAFSTIFPWPGLPDTVDVSRTVTARVAQ